MTRYDFLETTNKYMIDFKQYSNWLQLDQFHFWYFFCGQNANYKWRSYQSERLLILFIEIPILRY